MRKNSLSIFTPLQQEELHQFLAEARYDKTAPIHNTPMNFEEAFVGLTLLTFLFLFTSCLFWIVSYCNGFPSEMTLPMYTTIISWFPASMTSWCATAATIAASSYLRKTCLALTGYGYFTLLTSTRGFAALELVATDELWTRRATHSDPCPQMTAKHQNLKSTTTKKKIMK